MGSQGGTNVWARPLADGSHALVFLNAGATTADVTCDKTCFAAIGISPGQRFTVKDLWANSALPDITDASFTAKDLIAEGGHMMIVVKASSETPSELQV